MIKRETLALKEGGEGHMGEFEGKGEMLSLNFILKDKQQQKKEVEF